MAYYLYYRLAGLCSHRLELSLIYTDKLVDSRGTIPQPTPHSMDVDLLVITFLLEHCDWSQTHYGFPSSFDIPFSLLTQRGTDFVCFLCNMQHASGKTMKAPLAPQCGISGSKINFRLNTV